MARCGIQDDIDGAEQHFSTILLRFDYVHSALTSASRDLYQKSVEVQLSSLREEDPLLRYFWQARVAEAHVLKSWEPGILDLSYVIFSPTRAIFAAGSHLDHVKLVLAAYKVESKEELVAKAKLLPVPPLEDQLAIGVIFDAPMHSLKLGAFSFKGKKGATVKVPEPTNHLGQVIPPSATYGVEAVWNFYNRIFVYLKACCDRGPGVVGATPLYAPLVNWWEWRE